MCVDSIETKNFVYSLGADVCGIAGIDNFTNAPEGFHPKDIYDEAKSVIVFGKQFPKGVFLANTNVPYTFMKNKLVEIIDNISVQLTYKLEENGFNTVPVPADEPYEYWDSENIRGKGILSLKHSAVAAGLGIIGKNTLLINKQFGNRLLLGAVITKMELASDPVASELCPEGCRKCLNSCPQSALDGITINQKKCREIAYSSTPGGGGVIACNTCRKVCPFSKV